MKREKWNEPASCLKLLAHPKRLEVISLLLEGKKRSVGELAILCGLQQNVMSEHLSLMKNKGFLEFHKEGKEVFYAVKEPALVSILECINKRFR